MSVSSEASDIDQDELDIVNALTSCPICFEQFEVPKVLPCQHTFCLECLSNHYEATNAKRPCGPVTNFPCPNCRKTCYVPNNGLKDLPTDFKVEQIHDLLRKIQENRKAAAIAAAKKPTRPMSCADATMASVHAKALSSVANASCAVCVCNGFVDKPAVNLCVQCCKHFCAQCSTNHRKNSLFSDHTVMSMSPSSTDAGVGWKCDAHQADMTYFCVQCSTPACMLCVTCAHDKHSVLSQKEAVEQVRTELRTASGDLARKAKDVDGLFDVLKKLKQDHVKGYNDSTKTVKKAAQEAENKIKEAEKQALSALKTSHAEKLKAIAALEKLFHEQQKSAKNTSGLLADLSTNVSVKQTLSEFASLKTRAQTEADRNCEISSAIREFSVYKQDVSVNLGTIESKQLVVDEPKRSQTDASTRSAAPAVTGSPKTSSSIALKFKELGLRNKKNLPAVTESTSDASDTVSIDSGDTTSEVIRNRSDTLQRQALVERLQRRLSSRMGVAPPPPPSQPAPPTTGATTTAAAALARTTTIAPASPAASRVAATATNRISSPAMTRHATPPTGRPSTATTTTAAATPTARPSTATTSSAAAPTTRPSTATTTTAAAPTTRPATGTTPASPTPPHAVFRPTYFPAPVVAPIAARPTSNASESFNCKSLWKNETLTRCRGCSFASGDIVAVTDFNKAREGQGRSRISIFGPADGTKWQLLRTVESLFIGEPWDICYYAPSSSLLVTDRGPNVSLKSVKVNSVKDVSVMKSPSMEQPSGIALLKSGDLVVTDTGNKATKKIGVYTTGMTGRLSRLRDFGPGGDGEGDVMTANYVAVDHLDRVIISDTANHVVKVFSALGEELLKFSASASDDEDMIPQGVAVDEMNNIFVAEHTSNSVLKFSPDGMQIGEPLRMRAQPWGISYCAERKRLAVTTDKTIEIFQLS